MASPTSGKRKLGCCMYTWMRLDELMLRPLFIYKYARDKRQLQKAFFETYDQDGRDLEQIFGLADAGGDAKQANNASTNELMRKMSLLKRKRTNIKAGSMEFDLLLESSPQTGINQDDDLDDKFRKV